MALHENLGQLAIEAIDEYLIASANCLNFRKKDGGCLGYPATLLLLCVINALGVWLDGDNVTIDGRLEKITEGEPAGRAAAGHPGAASATVFEKQLQIITVDAVNFHAAFRPMAAGEDRRTFERSAP